MKTSVALKRMLGTIACSALLLSGAAYSAQGQLVQTWTDGDPTNTPTATTFGQANTPSWGWPNLPVPSNGATFSEGDNADGAYRINLNYWNEDSIGGNVPTATMILNVEDQTGAFTVMQSANSYYANGRPQDNCTPASADSQDSCRWAPPHNNPGGSPIHAPAGYPSIYNGCHYEQCTQPGVLRSGSTVNGAPYPIQVNQITGIPSHWIVDTSGRSADAVFNVAYDIWLDRNSPRNAAHEVDPAGTVLLPASPQSLWQNDGLEIMIWMNNQGYVQGGTSNGGIIQPGGNLVQTGVSIPGVSGTWDVWVTNTQPLSNQYASWYVVSYVRLDGVDDFQFDSKWFINHATTLDCVGGEKCAYADWWLTSIQAGFEIWANGEGLTSSYFEANPTWGTTAVQGGRTWEDPNTGIIHPIVYWGEQFSVTASCPQPNAGDTASYAVSAVDPETGTPFQRSGAMTRDATGIFTATIDAPYPAHDWATVTVTTNCVNGGGGTEVINVWIDPAGIVSNTDGEPLLGAKVTLYRSDSQNGPFTIVPDDSDIMSPMNRDNPDYTSQYGNFAWDVIAGFYKVRAEFGNCHLPGNENQAWVESAVFEVPPPVMDIELVLECPASSGGDNGNGSNLPSNVQVFTDWGAGYCANVFVTNNSSQNVDWATSFNVDGTIYDAWNMNYQVSGNTVTAGGVDWNNILAPNATTHSIGFCANRVPSGTCNWYGSTFPLCKTDNGWWGWENNQSCISQSLCNSQ